MREQALGWVHLMDAAEHLSIRHAGIVFSRLEGEKTSTPRVTCIDAGGKPGLTT
jgi:hypothetical protein